MNMLKFMAIAIVVVFACTVVLADLASFVGILEKPSCGGIKRETHLLCWRIEG